MPHLGPFPVVEFVADLVAIRGDRDHLAVDRPELGHAAIGRRHDGVVLELALGASERDSTLARLATMGLGEGQRAWVVALEVLPAVIAAAVAAWACALALPGLLAPDIDLSVFTGTSIPVPLAANVVSVAVPLFGLALVAVVSLGIEIRWGRRRGAASLRVGE